MISRKTARVAISVCMLLSVLEAWAQGPGRRHQPRLYNPATEVRVKGTVSEIRQVDHYGVGTGTHILLKTGTEELKVHLGPTAFLQRNGFALANGDQIEVVGSRVMVSGGDAILAREVQKDGKTLVLRDTNGVPKWNRRRHGGCCSGSGVY